MAGVAMRLSSGKTREHQVFGYLAQWIQCRHMTAHKRVKDRSKKKRVNDLEVVTERWKTVSKVTAILEVLKQQEDMIMPVRQMERIRDKISLPKPHSVSQFLTKSPKLFEMYEDRYGVVWCGMTPTAEKLMEEEEALLQTHSARTAEYVTRCLMMSVDKRLPLKKIAHFRRDFGLPVGFRTKWVDQYPDLFRVGFADGEECLKLESWNPAWAVTEVEKRILGRTEWSNHSPGMLALPFPLKFPAKYRKVKKYEEKIAEFQKREYLSPYAEASGLKAGSLEFDKRAVAVMHEVLSFTMEKRLVTDHLTHFRREMVMPQKLMRLLLKHIGIFYVSEKGKRFSVYLTEAYEGRNLVDKCPLVGWREKLLRMVGYRKRKNLLHEFSHSSEMEEEEHCEDHHEMLDIGDHQDLETMDTNALFPDEFISLGYVQKLYSAAHSPPR